MVATSDIDEAGAPASPAKGGGAGSLDISPRAYAIAAGVIALIAAGAVAYAFRGQLGGALDSAATRVLWAVGLGVAPLGLWLAALLAAALARASLLLHPRPWAAALALALASVAAMSAFSTGYGSPLDPLTNNGEVSLGGALATRATLGSAWLAALEAAALAAVAVAIVSPALARTSALRAGTAGARAWAIAYPAALALLVLGGAAAAALSVRAARGARGGGSALAAGLSQGARGPRRPAGLAAAAGDDPGPQRYPAGQLPGADGPLPQAAFASDPDQGGDDPYRPDDDDPLPMTAFASDPDRGGDDPYRPDDDDPLPMTAFASGPDEGGDDPYRPDDDDPLPMTAFASGPDEGGDDPYRPDDDGPPPMAAFASGPDEGGDDPYHPDDDGPLPMAAFASGPDEGGDAIYGTDDDVPLPQAGFAPGQNGGGGGDHGPEAADWPSAAETGGQAAVGLMAPPASAPEPAAANGVKFNRFWNGSGGPALAVPEPEPAPEPEPVPDPAEAAQIAAEAAEASPEVPILDRWASKWKLPDLSMLVDLPVKGITQEEMDETSVNIRDTLADYGVEVEVRMTQPGPAVTMYGLEPGWVRRYKQENATDEQGRPVLNEAGRPVRRRVETKTRVKVDTILQREKDLALALQTASMRIESPVMGTSLVGIEVPNARPELVTLRYVMKSPEFRKLRKKGALPIALGKGSGGDTAVLDMARLPHLLVAGATGSGKSVCLNTIVSCLTMEKSPSELRLLLIDPKRVELTPYNGIPHLLTPVVVETDTVVPLLKALINEMFKRYRHLEQEGVRNIASYNAKAKEKMPYLVLVVDELADLMMTSSMEVEQSLCRLAQLGRATGIHLVIATQRPSVDVLTGLIKANFPSRIAFGVTSQIDSRTILDTAGAEKLLGRGDMLYQPIDASRPARVQGVFISDEEVRELVDYWKTTKWAPLPEVGLEVPEDADGGGEGGPASTGDDLMDRAIELAQRQRKLSTSLLQRKLRIGYPRAARLMDELEEQGIVGPGDGSKSRDVIID